ncbi:hypothetical protein TSUD_12750 [Trifolium subterraneum]|uniref:Aminotransferase-like plant mobile domain-containing protein n=1 Tax=Trifolium subterraneum TaxID=3900 RepID=A0A2Z6PCE5_TRISU|nr:hypothetical protein TSUD_12750 [Trifolium subterraneum]
MRLELDSAIDDFIWRPYVRYADKCRMFYPNDETNLVPFKKDLMDEQMISFVLCLRVSELVGFESIEQYLPHRVATQFGLDRDIPGYVSRFNETKAIAWKNYSRYLPDSNKSLYFPSRFFQADVTTCYAKCWKKSVLSPRGFDQNVVPWMRCESSSQCRPHPEIPPPKLVDCTVTTGKSSDDGSKTSKGDNIVIDDDVPSNFVPKILKTMPSVNSVQECLEAGENIVAGGSSSLPPKQNTLTPSISVENRKHVFEDGNENKEAGLSCDIICESGTQEGSYSDLFELIAAEHEERVSRLERVHRELKMERRKVFSMKPYFDQGTKPIQAVSNFSDGNEVNIIAAPREISIFSSSLSDLFRRKLRLSTNNALYGRSLDTNASHFEEEGLVNSFEELEAQIISNLLPDEDDLLSGVTDWNDHIIQDSTGDDIDELHIFSSVGGLELEDVYNSSSGEKNSKIIVGAQHNQLGLCNTSPEKTP